MDKSTQIYNELLREARAAEDIVWGCKVLVAHLERFGIEDTCLTAKIKDRLSWIPADDTSGDQAWDEVECELDHILSINA